MQGAASPVRSALSLTGAHGQQQRGRGSSRHEAEPTCTKEPPLPAYRPKPGSAPRSAGLVKGGRLSVLIEQRMRGLGFSCVRCGSIMAVDGQSRTMASCPTLFVPSPGSVGEITLRQSANAPDAERYSSGC